MKTILVPTDFSKLAENAINYAAELGKLTKAKIILFHVFHIPVTTTEVPIIVPDIESLEKDCMESLKRIEKNIYQRYDKEDLSVKCVCTSGFAVDEINLYSKEHKIDLIVLGIKGAGYFTEKFIGSTTTSLIKRSQCPILVIPEEVRFKKIKKIVFACDYEENENKKTLKPLKELVQLFQGHVYILNIVRKPEPVFESEHDVSDFTKLQHSLSDIDHSFHYLQNEEITDGINKFVDDRKMDMIVMIPRKHTILEKLFKEPHTKRMAFHTKVPLLTLH